MYTFAYRYRGFSTTLKSHLRAFQFEHAREVLRQKTAQDDRRCKFRIG
jgi:hypothetical protein